MTTRELWKQSPEFRQSLRKLVMYASGGFLVGIGWVQIGKRLPDSWREIWAFAFLFAVIAGALYMLWDIRRLGRQRLQWEERNRKRIEEIMQLDQQFKRMIEARMAEQPPERRGWLQ